MRRALILIVFVVTMGPHALRAYERLQGPTEALYWDQSKAFNGYTLFGAKGGTYLIDMEGRVVRSWSKCRTNPRFLDNGRILDSSTDDPSQGSGFVEVDWNDNVVWRYTESRSNYAPHHDFIRIWNKKLGAYTTLYIANKSLTHSQAIAAGCDPSGKYEGAQMDAIVEVDMNGKIVWEWWFFDHAIQDIDPTKANYVGVGKTIADHPGRIDLNLPGRPVKRDWLHCNSLDYHPQLGHIVTNSVQGEFYVIDHDGTFVAGDPAASIALAAGPAGDFLYRFGDPARYQQGDPPSVLEDWTQCTVGHKQLGGSHDVQWIDAGLPGAGHFLIFNNGQYLFDRTPQSYAVEIDGFRNAARQNVGTYVNPPDAGYDQWQPENKDTHKQKRNVSRQIVWQYGSKSNQGFFSHIGSGCQRLPNGNTLICAMTEGHLLEVTAAGELVWEYINPINTDGIKEINVDQYPMNNAMFRAYRYAADHPALLGRGLPPGSTLTGREPAYATPSLLGQAPGRITSTPSTAAQNAQRGAKRKGQSIQGTMLLATNTAFNAAAEPPANGTTSTRPLPDTGQVLDYTATWGEDSDYSINSPSYKDNGDGTITDCVTGLMWQKIDGGFMTWEQALAYAQELVLAGYEDWRLPNVKELQSLCDVTGASGIVDSSVFPTILGAAAWSSTTLAGHVDSAWTVDLRLGTVSYTSKTGDLQVACVRGEGLAPVHGEGPPLKYIAGGTFLMGDHHDLGGAEHRNDEVPVHSVTLDGFSIGTYEITNQQYCEFLNDALLQGIIEVDAGYVLLSQTGDLLCDTYQSDGYSRIRFDGAAFTVADHKADHPVVGIRWQGAAAYCNWLSVREGLDPCYDLPTQVCDLGKNGYRLPTEAEWEYAGRGGLYDPYRIYPWGDDADNAKANWPNSGDPFEFGPMPYTTPVGFYDGQFKQRADHNWPAPKEIYQTRDGANGYGLYDMAGNVWEWTNDWYHSDYYAVSPSYNPPGPPVAKPMPDGKVYHVLRSGNWYNGPQGHSRVSNRNPAYFRGPQDPHHPWYHIGFRIARRAEVIQPPFTAGVVKPGAQVTLIADGFAFAEGPAANDKGEIYFSDLQTSRIYKLNDKGQLTIFLNNSGGTNGLMFDRSGNLIACQGDLGRLVAIDNKKNVTVLADTYDGRRFNKPNDLWIDPAGGIYFSDPAYGTKPVQDGEHVYYLAPDRSTVTRVIDDMIRPNGLIGTPDGRTLYVADHGAGLVYAYTVAADGRLFDKRLFVSKACDGMTLDERGNVYITNAGSVLVCSPDGEQIETVEVGGQVTNVCFGGPTFMTLYITNTQALYAIDMLLRGAR